MIRVNGRFTHSLPVCVTESAASQKSRGTRSAVPSTAYDAPSAPDAPTLHTRFTRPGGRGGLGQGVEPSGDPCAGGRGGASRLFALCAAAGMTGSR